MTLIKLSTNRRMNCLTDLDTDRLVEKAQWVRLQVLERVAAAGMGHLGGTFSCVDILVVLYYGGILRFDAALPDWTNRDRLVVGKGHACLALYAIWADLGMLPWSRVGEFGENGSSLSGQLNLDTPGVEYNSGSLGNAVGVAAGMAMAAKMDGRESHAFALIGDGECAEGSIWEALMFASGRSLSNLITIVDRNRLGVTAAVEEDEFTGNLDGKVRNCGWEVRVIDGHDVGQLLDVLRLAGQTERPLMIIADTVKGKGVSFMENGIKWHHSIPTDEQFALARRELGGKA